MAKNVIVHKSTRLHITGNPVLTGKNGDLIQPWTATVTGGKPPYAFSMVGVWPDDIVLSTGTTTATPTGMFVEDGTFSGLSISVRDSVLATASLPLFTMVIDPQPLPSFVVSDQAIDFGALTLANAGGCEIIGNKTIVAATITGGTLNDTHSKISAGGVITRDLIGWSSGTLIVSCTDNDGNTDTATITVTAIANAFSVANDSEANAVLALGNVTLSGKTMYCRYNGGTIYGAMNNFGRFTGLTSPLTITSHDHDNMAIWQRFVLAASSGTVGNITLSYLAFSRPYANWANNNMIVLGNTVSAHDVVIDHCTFTSDLVPGRLGGTVYQGIYRYFIGVGTAGFSDLTVTDCEASYGVHFVSFTGTGLTITGNHVHHMWGDFLNLTPQSNGGTTGTITVENNCFHDPIANMSTLHPDFIQAFAYNQIISGAINDLTVRGNVVFPGAEGEIATAPSTGPLIDFMLMQTAGATVTFSSHIVEGNLAYLFTIHGITYEGVLSGTSRIENNSLLRYWSLNQANELNGFHVYEYPQIRGNFSGGGITISGNVCEEITIVSGSPTQSNNNKSLTKTLASYTALFQGTSFRPQSRDEALSEALMKANGALDVDNSGTWNTGDVGAVGTTSANGYYDFDAGALN